MEAPDPPRAPPPVYEPHINLGAILQMLTVVSVAGGFIWQAATWVTDIRADLRTEVQARLDYQRTLAADLAQQLARETERRQQQDASLTERRQQQDASQREQVAADAERRRQQDAMLADILTQHHDIVATLARVDRSFQRFFVVAQPQPRRPPP